MLGSQMLSIRVAFTITTDSRKQIYLATYPVRSRLPFLMGALSIRRRMGSVMYSQTSRPLRATSRTHCPHLISPAPIWVAQFLIGRGPHFHRMLSYWQKNNYRESRGFSLIVQFGAGLLIP